MVNKKIKVYNFVLLLIAAILIVVSFLTISGAWFTQSKVTNMQGKVGKASGTVSCNAGLTNNTTYFTLSQYSANGNIVTQPNLTVTSTSNIDTYLRVRFDINWTNLDNTYGSVYDYIDFDLADYWFASDNTTDNAKMQSGWVYYKTNSSTFRAISKVTKDAGDNDVFASALLLNGISIKSAMPDSVKVKVYAEFVQADAVGQSLFN